MKCDLEAHGETLVVAPSKGTLAPLRHLGVAVEQDVVLGDPLVVGHVEVVETLLRVFLRPIWSEVEQELLAEPIEVIEPGRNISRNRIGVVGLEPVECRASEVGDGVIYARGMGGEILRAVSEVDLELEEVRAELIRIGAVKGVGRLDFG